VVLGAQIIQLVAVGKLEVMREFLVVPTQGQLGAVLVLMAVEAAVAVRAADLTVVQHQETLVAEEGEVTLLHRLTAAVVAAAAAVGSAAAVAAVVETVETAAAAAAGRTAGLELVSWTTSDRVLATLHIIMVAMGMP
jgi:hypothetical protein